MTRAWIYADLALAAIIMGVMAALCARFLGIDIHVGAWFCGYACAIRTAYLKVSR